jgi:hypothetical protein
MGEEEFIVPPISLGQLRGGVIAQLAEHDRLVAEGKIFEAMDIRAQVILAAMRRNYPDFSEEKLLANLDMGNTGGIWLSILGASGFTPGEETAPVATTTNRGNGTLSLSTGA